MQNGRMSTNSIEVGIGEGMEKLLSVEDAALYLGGLSKTTIYAWFTQGRLRRTKVGRRTMVRESELIRVICDEPISVLKTSTPAISEELQPSLQGAA
jgi:excisionase family DNA binding protein